MAVTDNRNNIVAAFGKQWSRLSDNLKQRFAGLNGLVNPESLGNIKDSLQSSQSKSLSGNDLCLKCASERVTKSKVVGIELFIVSVFPRRPYRCMDCYHRFWQSEGFGDDARRVRTWSVIAILFFLFVVWKVYGAYSALNATPVSPIDEPMPALQEPVVTSQEPDEGDESAVGTVARSVIATAEAEAVELNEAELTTAYAEITDTETTFESEAPVVVSDFSAEQQLTDTLESWRLAWQDGDADKYLAFYDNAFMPEGDLSKWTWRQQRHQRVTPEKEINLRFTNVNIEIADGEESATATFRQHYASKTYREVALKQLEFQKRDTGWFIVSERQLR